MANAGDELEPLVEAHDLIASAGALLRELVEEDVSEFERIEEPPPLATSVEEAQSSPPASVSAAASKPATRRTPAPNDSGSARPGTAGPVPWGDGQPSLADVEAHLGDCRRCSLCEGRSKIVFGSGNPNADLLFVGEGPGEQEDRQGLPFVGRAGELLTQMIEKGIGLSRDEVYICNIVKCRPPQNRTPLPPEVSACRPFLDGQIRAVAPKVIVTLGKPAASLLLDREIAITRMRGTWHDYKGIPLMPTLHPAYVLRQYTPENRRAVWQDLKAAVERSRA